MAETTIQTLCDTAKLAAMAGGQTLLEWRGKFSSREKAPADLVTDADLAAQEVVASLLNDAFPSHAFVGEESQNHEEPPGDVVCWVVDPLDGTTNYVHGYPHYATSVAAVRDGELLAGAIYDPNLGELFWAAQGLGAWMGETRIHVSECDSLGDALVALSIPPRTDLPTPELQDFVEVAPRCQAIRRSGSAALNLAYVAAGRIDAHWARSIHPWDVAAGVLLILEAGGFATAVNGGAFNVWKAEFLTASTAALHEELLAVLSRTSAE